MGLYKMDHSTAKPVLARLQSVYRPFKQSSENALVSVADGGVEVPAEYRLEQNYPNPFNPTTTIRAEFPVQGRVRLSIYDLLGREVAVLLYGEYPAGRHTAVWDAGRMASGAYFSRLSVNGRIITKTMMLIK